MDLVLSGKVLEILEEQSGQGKNGPWRKRDFILETPGNYPKKVCVTQWGDDIDSADVQPGDEIKASIDIQSREYNGKWYTDVKAWRIEKESASAPPPSTDHGDAGPQEEPPFPDDDDLPF